MRKNLIIYFSLFTLFIGCSKNNNTLYKDFEANHKTDISINKLDISSIHFDTLPSSYIGLSKITNDTLYFVDQKFTRVLSFDKELNYLGWNLTKGNGPDEIAIGGIDGFEKMGNGNFMFLGSNTDWHTFTSRFEKVSSYIMEKTKLRNENRDSPNEVSPEDPIIYSFVYPKLIIREFDNRLFFNIMVQHPEFNFIHTHNEYYENSRVLSEMDPETGKTISIFGRFSPAYQSNNFTMNQVSLLNFDISKETGTFYLNFEADPVIYEFDSDFKPLTSYGILGKDMKPNYKRIDTIEDFQRENESQRKSTHYFTWLEYVEEGELLFRSYSLGNSNEDGLQIYKGNTLIGDVKVPKGFKVLGKLGSTFISHPILDEQNDKMTFHTFKLKADE